MCKMCSVAFLLVGVVFLTAATTADAAKPINAPQYSSMRETVKKITLPAMEQPTWLKKQLAAEAAAAIQARRAPSQVTVVYQVANDGAAQSSFEEFRLQVNQTLNDSRGWARLNVAFKEVASGGQFNLILAAANRVPTYSSACSAEYSCRVGQSVIINQDRWQGATPSWNSAGGNLRDYRHMVVNHEVGHWLGHGHSNCGGAGQPAPVMQQQSIDLQGCAFNPWPLAGELSSPTLGI